MDILKFDSRFIRFLDKLVDCIILNHIWLLFSLPIFTIGPASAAMYYTLDKVICKDTGHVWKEFWYAFKLNFKQATVVGLIALVMLIILGSGSAVILLSITTGGSVGLFGIVYLIVVIFWIMWLHFWLPYIARFQDPIKLMFQNTLMLCLTQLPLSLLLLLAPAAAAVLLICVIPAVAVIPTALCVLPSAYTFIVRLILEHIFNKYIPPEAQD